MKLTKPIIITIIIVTVLIILIGGGIGIWYFFFNKPSDINIRGQANNRGQFRNNLVAYTGQITSIDGNKLVVNLDNNKGQRIIATSSTTQFRDTVGDTKENIIKEGNMIIINGTKSGDIFTVTEVSLNTIQGDQNPNRVMPSGFIQDDPNRPNNFPIRMEGGGFGGNNGNMLIGSITKINGDIITINSFQNQVQTVDISKAKFTKITSIKLTDLKTDDKISINGTEQSSNFNARTITRVNN